MKKTNLLALGGALVLGLASCGKSGAIDFNKVYLSGEMKIGVNCRVDIYLKEDNKALFDFVTLGDVPTGMPDFGTVLDMNGTYAVEGKNYVFTFQSVGQDGKAVEQKLTATYVEGKDYTHECPYTLVTEFGEKSTTLTGSLPL